MKALCNTIWYHVTMATLLYASCAPTRAPVFISVASLDSREGKPMQTGRNVSREFQVVVTNISENPIRLWDNSNQWGYYNVTFLVTKKDGTKVEIFPKVPFFTRNVASFEILTSGESRIVPINMNAEWGGLANLTKDVTLRIRYSIPATSEAEDNKVLIGEFYSKEFKIK